MDAEALDQIEGWLRDCLEMAAHDPEWKAGTERQIAAFRELRAEAERLRADAARLDWLATTLPMDIYRAANDDFVALPVDGAGGSGPTLRAAIDAATAGEGKP